MRMILSESMLNLSVKQNCYLADFLVHFDIIILDGLSRMRDLYLLGIRNPSWNNCHLICFTLFYVVCLEYTNHFMFLILQLSSDILNNVETSLFYLKDVLSFNFSLP